MNRSRFLAILLLAAAAAVASAQSPSQSPNPQNSPTAQTGPSSQPGSQPFGANPSSPLPAKTATPGTADGTSTGSAANTIASQSQLSEAPEMPSAAPVLSNSDLQTQIQNALTKEPTLSGDTVNVTVSAEAIDISGSVATAREKLTATRIVQSYAGNRKVMSHLAVGGHNRTASPDAPAQSGDEPAEKSGVPGRFEPAKVAPGANSNRPQF